MRAHVEGFMSIAKVLTEKSNGSQSPPITGGPELAEILDEYCTNRHECFILPTRTHELRAHVEGFRSMRTELTEKSNGSQSPPSQGGPEFAEILDEYCTNRHECFILPTRTRELRAHVEGLMSIAKVLTEKSNGSQSPPSTGDLRFCNLTSSSSER
jgi:hypothetical protein